MNKSCRGIYTIDDFLKEEEIKGYIELIKNPPIESSEFTEKGNFKNFKAILPEVADSMYRKLIQHIQEDDGKEFLRANKYIMTGYYKTGDRFGLHTDTGLYYNKKEKEKSRWTLLIYLNDDFRGGRTLFYTDTGEHTVSIEPKRGRALVFDIDLWHQGEEVEGEKLWIGCEIIGKLD